MDINGKPTESPEKVPQKRRVDPEIWAIRQIEQQLSRIESHDVRLRVVEFVHRRVIERRGEQLHLFAQRQQRPEPAPVPHVQGQGLYYPPGQAEF